MSDTPLRRIRSVTARPGYRLSVAWERGAATLVDLSDMIRKGGVFSTLADEQTFVAVRVGENSRTVEWPEPKDSLGYPVIEIDAEGLFERARSQNENRLISDMKRILDVVKAKVPAIPRPQRS